MASSPIPVIHSFPVWLPQTQTWLFNQAKFLPAQIDVHIVCEYKKNLEQFYLPNIHALEDAPAWRRNLDRSFRKLKLRSHLHFLNRIARRHAVRIIHSHSGMVACANHSAVPSSTKHVVTFYGADATQNPSRTRYTKIFQSIDQVFCEGPFMAKVLANLGCPEEKIIVHHLGVDLTRLPFRPRSWSGNEPLRFLIAGTFREKKGIPLAIRAIAAIRQHVDVELTLIGDATHKPGDADEKKRILATLEETSLLPNTTLLGFCEHAELLEVAYRHHVFLSPSLTAADGDAEGGAPVAIAEMAATGMLIVSSKHCDIPNVVGDESTGYLAEEGDLGSLIQKLQKMISDRDWSEMLCAGRRRIEQEFCCVRQGARLAACYQEIATN